MAGIHGDIKDFPLADLLAMLESNLRTGTLKIDYPKTDRRAGALYLVKGVVVDAVVGPIEGEAAAFELLDSEAGVFQFAEEGRPRANRSITRGLQDLLMESARESDSKKRLRGTFPELRVVPTPCFSGDEYLKGVKLHGDEKEIANRFDGYSDFRELMAKHSIKEIDILQVASMLLEKDKIAILEPRMAVRAQASKTGLFGFGKKLGIELSSAMLKRWKSLSPYAHGIDIVKILVLGGPHIVPVKFVDGIPDGVIIMPKSDMEAMGISAGDHLGVRPAKP